MHSQFELKLCNYTLFAWLGFIGLLASLGLAGLILEVSNLPKGNLQFIAFFFVAGSGFYGVYRLLKKVVISDALLTVEPGSLAIRYLGTDRTIKILFAEVATYRDEFLRDGRELRFHLHSGKKVKLAVNSFLGPTGDYDGLLRAIQHAIAKLNATHPVLIGREKSFFEKPFATILLVVISAVILLGVGDILIKHKPLKGNFISAIGAFISYAGMWYTARARQKQP